MQFHAKLHASYKEVNQQALRGMFLSFAHHFLIILLKDFVPQSN
jgi:hypothetical protein